MNTQNFSLWFENDFGKAEIFSSQFGFTLHFSDGVTQDWAEEYFCIQVAVARFACLVEIMKAGGGTFTQDGEDFERSAFHFFDNETDTSEQEKIEIANAPGRFANEISYRRTTQGAWELSTLNEAGELVVRQYFDYTQSEATELFQNELKG